ncbi:MAG: hypothetical protein WA418_07895 [Bradyrhizobium sp.]
MFKATAGALEEVILSYVGGDADHCEKVTLEVPVEADGAILLAKALWNAARRVAAAHFVRHERESRERGVALLDGCSRCETARRLRVIPHSKSCTDGEDDGAVCHACGPEAAKRT